MSAMNDTPDLLLDEIAYQVWLAASPMGPSPEMRRVWEDKRDAGDNRARHALAAADRILGATSPTEPRAPEPLEVCAECSGLGKDDGEEHDCDVCGYTHSPPCAACNGTGRAPDPNEEEVDTDQRDARANLTGDQMTGKQNAVLTAAAHLAEAQGWLENSQAADEHGFNAADRIPDRTAARDLWLAVVCRLADPIEPTEADERALALLCAEDGCLRDIALRAAGLDPYEVRERGLRFVANLTARCVPDVSDSPASREEVDDA